MQDTNMKLTPRAQMITARINLAGQGVEYGPLRARLIPKPGYDVLYVDYADREYLMKHYAKNPAVDVSLIPEIDIVTGGRSLSEFLGEMSIDYVVASHVMEHVPDFLGWLESNLKLLRVGGRIAVAFPDKRYCFDIKRRPTCASDILCAYLEQRTRPSFQQLCDQYWNACSATAISTWNGTVTPQTAKYIHSRDKAFSLMKSKLNSGDYTDCHCWVFEDFRFVEVVNELRQFSTVGFDIIDFQPTRIDSLEFYVTFERR